MQDIIATNFYNYLFNNYPDLLISIGQESSVTSFVQDKVAVVNDLLNELLAEGKPAYIIYEMCMVALTKELGPSRYNYLQSILEEEFETDYRRLNENGTLRYEVINLIIECNVVFELFGFTEENEANRKLRYAITGEIQAYLKSN